MSRPTVGLRKETCRLCEGRGWYAYGALGKVACECDPVEIDHAEWRRWNKPHTWEEYIRRANVHDHS